MTLRVTSAVLERLVAEAQAAHPRECCGLLFGSGAAIIAHRSAVNVHPSPETRFEIDPQTLVDAHRAMRGGGPQLVGYYHSHPSGRTEPSATDLALAACDGMIWAIIGGGRVILWRADRTAGSDGLTPLPYRVTEA